MHMTRISVENLMEYINCPIATADMQNIYFSLPSLSRRVDFVSPFESFIFSHHTALDNQMIFIYL